MEIPASTPGLSESVGLGQSSEICILINIQCATDTIIGQYENLCACVLMDTMLTDRIFFFVFLLFLREKFLTYTTVERIEWWAHDHLQ